MVYEWPAPGRCVQSAHCAVLSPSSTMTAVLQWKARDTFQAPSGAGWMQKALDNKQRTQDALLTPSPYTTQDPFHMLGHASSSPPYDMPTAEGPTPVGCQHDFVHGTLGARKTA